MVSLALAGVQLVPDSSLFFHIFLILLMIWILNRTVFKPINRVLEAREKKSGGRSGEAQLLLQQAAEKKSGYEKSLLEARSESYQAIEETRNAALADKTAQVQAVKVEVSAQLTEQKAELQTQVNTARAELESNAKTIAEKIGSNVLKRPLVG